MYDNETIEFKTHILDKDAEVINKHFTNIIDRLKSLNCRSVKLQTNVLYMDDKQFEFYSQAKYLMEGDKW